MANKTKPKKARAEYEPVDDFDYKQDVEERTETVGGDPELRSLLAKEYKTAQDAMRYFSLDWDAYEDLLFVQSRNADNSRARLSEGSLSTIVVERAGRVMAQFPTGSVEALGLQDTGKGLLMDLVLSKYIHPNASYQYDLETKLFMWDMYSNVYGIMPMCYDWCDSANYVGPDCWLVPIRNFFPQQGRFSIENCDFVYISNFISREYLLQLVNDNVATYDLDAIKEILRQTEHGHTKPKARDDYLRVNPMFEWRRRAPFTDTGDIEVVTKYEAGTEGRWIDFCPDFGNRVIRNILNPHQNSKIPVVLKYALPSLDSIVGLGDMEKGRYLQDAMDTTINLQIDAQKLRTYPPIKVVNGNVVMPTVRMTPGAKWLVSNPNDVSHHQFPDIENNLNLSYQFLKGALSNVTGNTTTQTSAEANSPVQGKTPQAIKAQQASQSTRDAIDTKLMEKSITELFQGMIGLINDVEHDDPIELYLFGQEIAQIAQAYPDIKDAVKLDTRDIRTAKRAKITIRPSRIKNDKGYVYRIDPLSTQAKDMDKEHQQLLEIWQEFMPQAGVIEQLLNAAGQTLDFPEFFKELIITGGLKDWKKIIKPLAMGSEPGQQGASNTGNGQAAQPQPSESISYKDIAGTDAGNAMLQQAQLPPVQQPVQPQMTQAAAPVVPQPQMQPQIGSPDIQQAQAQINARSEALRAKLQQEVSRG